MYQCKDPDVRARGQRVKVLSLLTTNQKIFLSTPYSEFNNIVTISKIKVYLAEGETYCLPFPNGTKVDFKLLLVGYADVSLKAKLAVFIQVYSNLKRHNNFKWNSNGK